MTTTIFTTLENAFRSLVVPPTPLMLDARRIGPPLPERGVPLDELRTLLISRIRDRDVRDRIWRQLLGHARTWRPEWTVGVTAVALPGLRRMAAALAVGHRDQADDLRSELMTGFVAGLRNLDPEPPSVWPRLCWSAWRAALAVRRNDDWLELPAEFGAYARTPHRPYGHPDLILGRAVAAGVLSREEADLIGDTRLEGVLTEELAHGSNTSAGALRMRRHRAEVRLADALAMGRVNGG